MDFIPGVFKLFEGFLCLAGLSESKMSIPPYQDPGKSVGIPAVSLGDIRVKERAPIQGAEMEAEKRCP